MGLDSFLKHVKENDKKVKEAKEKDTWFCFYYTLMYSQKVNQMSSRT